MFGDLRKKLNSVIKEGFNISGNISNTYIRPPGASLTQVDNLFKFGASSKVPIPSKVNIQAGCEYLEQKEEQWSKIHNLNEQNAELASNIDNKIIKIKENSTVLLTEMSDLNSLLTSVPSIVETLKTCSELVINLGNHCKNIERELFQLEDLAEILELKERQCVLNIKMEIYKEKKLDQLHQVRKDLMEKHTNNVNTYEQQIKLIQEERQAVFQDAFQNDVLCYTTLGTLPKVELRSTKELTLEEIILDNRESEELDNFLNN